MGRDTADIKPDMSEKRREKQYPVSHRHEPPAATRRSCLWQLVVISLWILIPIFLIILGIRTWFEVTLYPPRREEMRKIDNEVITLPPEWQTAAPVVPRAVVEFQQKFYDEMGALTIKYEELTLSDSPILQKMRKGHPLTATEQVRVDNLLIELKPIAEQTSRGVQLAGYTSDVHGYLDKVNLLAVRALSLGAGVAALQMARQGDCHGAVDMAALPLRYSKRNSHSVLIHHILSIAIVQQSARTFYALADQCNDPAVLRYALRLLQDQRQLAYPQHLDSWLVSDYTAPLALAKGAGYPVDLSPQPLAGYLRQYIELQKPEYFNWLIKHLPSDDPRRKVAKLNLDRHHSARSSMSSSKRWEEIVIMSVHNYNLAPMLTGHSSEAWFDGFYGTSNITSVEDRVKTATARYELARLRLAQRLAEIETSATAPIGPNEIKPYMDTIPADPYSTHTTGAPSSLRFSAVHNSFYSIGPDQYDDGMMHLYIDDEYDGDLVVGP